MGAKKLVLILWVVILLFAFMSSTALAEVVVVTHKSVNTENLELKDIKKIFLGKKMYWDDNKKITLFILSKSPTHQEFLKKYLGKSENQFTNYWKQLLFTGKGMLPNRVTDDEMIAKIKETEGAIGYIAANLATEDVNIIKLK